MATTETIDDIFDICCRRNYKRLELNLTYRIHLHWYGEIKTQGKNRVEKFRFNVFNLSIIVLHAFLTSHASTPNWMKLSGSMSAGLIHKKNEPFMQFNNSAATLFLTLSTAPLRSVVTFHTLLLDSLSCLLRFAVGRVLMKSKHCAVPMLFLDTLVTVFCRSLPSVLDNKGFQEPLFLFEKFWFLDYENQNWYFWCESKGWPLNLRLLIW